MVNHAMNNERQRLRLAHIRLVHSTMPRRMMAKITVVPYKAGTVKHATINKIAKITDTVFVGHVHQLSINNTDKDRLRIIRLARKMPCRIHD